MINTSCADENCSTTQLLTKDKTKIINNPNDKFETILFLPEGENRKAEGGLRTKSYFKQSYEDKPLISIITVVYNGEKYLEETIQSVLNQTYDNVEYIIIDGGSTDGTLDIIRKYEDAIDYWVSEKDKGIYDAMNKGIILAQGDIIGLLNADDTYLIESVISNIITNFIQKKCDLIHAKIVQIDNKNRIISTVGIDVNFEKLLFKMKVAHPSVYVAKKVYLKHGLFNTKYKIAADYEMMLRVWCHVKKCFIDDIFIQMKMEGISNKLVYKSYSEAREIGIEYGLNSYYAYINFIKEIFKHYFFIKIFRKLFK